MTMNSSGPISLGGSTAGQSINLENGNSATAQVSLNDTAVRNLAGVASGAITMPTNFYGKSNVVNISYTFSANTANASLNVTTIAGYSAGKSNITITVNSGIYLYSTSTANAGLTLTGGTTGDTILLVNNGYIMGQGATGGSGERNAPNGATALSLGFNTTINNTNASAYIGGGGGGGGAIGNGYTRGGGGGGAGGGAGGSGTLGPGGAGGGIGSIGGRGTNSTQGGYGGGAGGGGGASGVKVGNGGGGGGGGRIFPGTGGAGGSTNGASGGSGSSAGTAVTTVTQAGAGGGGWGASGGNENGGTQGTWYGGTGGNAVALNGYSVTWVSGDTSRVWGAVS